MGGDIKGLVLCTGLTTPEAHSASNGSVALFAGFVLVFCVLNAAARLGPGEVLFTISVSHCSGLGSGFTVSMGTIFSGDEWVDETEVVVIACDVDNGIAGIGGGDSGSIDVVGFSAELSAILFNMVVRNVEFVLLTATKLLNRVGTSGGSD